MPDRVSVWVADNLARRLCAEGPGLVELPLPLYCVDDVSKALVDLRPEGAPALKTVNFHRAHITTRSVHDLLRDGARQR